MLDLLRRQIAVLAALLLGWLLYADLNPDEGKKTAEAKVERHEIAARYLEQRPADQPPLQVEDPFRFLTAVVERVDAAGRPVDGSQAPPAAPAGTPAAPAGAPAVLDWSPVDVAAAWVGALRVLARDVGGAFGAGPAATHGPASMDASPQRPFTLELESTLDLPEGGMARISGFQVAEGESLPALDPDKPPRLLDVSGTTVLVAHGDVIYTLDLHAHPRIDVGQPSEALPAAPAVRAAETRAPAAAAAAKPAAPRAAPQPGAPKPAGVYKSRKKPGKK